MIAKQDDGRFRCVLGRRFTLAQSSDHPHYAPRRSVGLGSITSRPKTASTDVEYLAWRHGLTVAEVMRIINEGVQ